MHWNLYAKPWVANQSAERRERMPTELLLELGLDKWGRGRGNATPGPLGALLQWCRFRKRQALKVLTGTDCTRIRLLGNPGRWNQPDADGSLPQQGVQPGTHGCRCR